MLLILTPFFPFICALVLQFLPIWKNEKWRNWFVSFSLVGSFVLTLLLALGKDQQSALYNLAGIMPLGFMVDDTARLFSLLATAMFLVSGIFAQGYFHKDDTAKRFFVFYIGTLGAILGVCYSSTPVSMYLFFELMTLISMGLVLHTKEKKSIVAGVKYLLYSVAGAMMGLFGIFYFSAGMETATFSLGGNVFPAYLANNPELSLWVLFITVLGFGTKAGLFPMHGWLPTAHPVAPAPASAILSGVVTKMGVICIIRMVFFVVGGSFMASTWVQTVLLTLSLITVFMGSMCAYKENNLKKRLAYSTVSQVSYVLFGVFTLNAVALNGAMMHVVFHSVMKNALFLCAGSIIHQTHKTDVRDLRGMGAKMPVTFWCFTLAGVGLVGVPPLSGFISKWGIASGAIASGIELFSWLGPVVLLLSALLTAGYLIPISVDAFFSNEKVDNIKEASCNMLVPVIVLAVLCVGLGIYVKPVDSITRFIMQFVS